MDWNAWLAIATSVYAGGTLLLAAVTATSATRAVKSAQETNNAQILASNDTTTRQIAAAADTTKQQIEAGREAARVQGHTAAISRSRQGWINQLRDEVTGFLTEAGIRSVLDSDMSFFHMEDRDQERVRILRSMKSHLNKVRLLINPTEGESTELVEMLQRLYDRDEGGEDFENSIVAHTQGILKIEWERVKRGEETLSV